MNKRSIIGLAISALTCSFMAGLAVHSLASGHSPTEVHADYPEQEHNGITFQAWDRNDRLPYQPGNYYLTQDVEMTYEWDIAGDIKLDLNGHYAVVGGDTFAATISGGRELSIYDYGEEGEKETRYIRLNENKTYSDILDIPMSDDLIPITGGLITGMAKSGFLVKESSKLNLYGGTLCCFEGAVQLRASTFNMYGGTISHNYLGSPNDTGSKCGGAVHILEEGFFKMDGGTISDNYSSFGGGVMLIDEGTFEMNGGTICNNDSYAGGGVETWGTTTINGGSIINNKTKGSGAGINYVRGSLVLSGEPLIKDNKGPYSDANVNIYPDYRITIEAPLTNTTPIGVLTRDHIITKGGCAEYKDKFTSDDPNYVVSTSDQGELILVEKSNVPGGGGQQPGGGGQEPGTGENPGGGNIDPSANNHGFCIGWIALIINIVLTLCAGLYLILRLKPFKLPQKVDEFGDKVTAKEVLLTLIGCLVLLANFIFDLIVIILHQCPVSIIAFILGVLLFGGMAFWYAFSRKQGKRTPLEEKVASKFKKKGESEPSEESEEEK